MGVLNVTPDSFFDGGRFESFEKAVERGREMRRQGADIVDVGGESTRPGADEVDERKELRRVMPVIEALCAEQIPVSIDSSKPTVVQEAVRAGACFINDVTGFQNGEMIRLAASTNCSVCAMHMRGTPRTMQADTRYDDLIEELVQFFVAKTRELNDAGIASERIWLDPGIGFGKDVAGNLLILRSIPRFAQIGQLMIGASRKSFLGKIVGEPDPEKRLAPSLAAAVFAVHQGVGMVRVHDVQETRAALNVWSALQDISIIEYSNAIR